MFSDPYWNSAEQNLLTYIVMLMTSWAVVCDIYYLEPTKIRVRARLHSVCVGRCVCVYIVLCLCARLSAWPTLLVYVGVHRFYLKMFLCVFASFTHGDVCIPLLDIHMCVYMSCTFIDLSACIPKLCVCTPLSCTFMYLFACVRKLYIICVHIICVGFQDVRVYYLCICL